jgi:predicted TIM-barrel fold metal-dependent hydrolase
MVAGEAPHRIDVHYHILPGRYAADPRVREHMRGQFVDPATLAWTPQQAVEDMDKNGIARGIGSIVVPGVWFGDAAHGRKLARDWNDEAAGIASGHKGRFGFFAPVPLPDIDGSLAEIAYALDVLKADGIGLMTSYDDRWLGDPHFAPVWEELDRRKAVVFVHPTVPVCCAGILPAVPSFIVEVPTDTTRAIASLLLTGTAARFPGIRFIFSHGGGTVTVLAARISGLARMRRDLAENLPGGAEPALAKLFYDTAIAANPVTMAALRALVPASQILFGSDYPFAPIAASAMGLRGLNLPPADLLAIERGNAEALLRRA